MTSDRILQLSAAVEAMPDGPSRQRFGALLAELSEAEGLPTPVPSLADDALDPAVDLVVDPAVGEHVEAPMAEPSSALDGLLGDVVPLPAGAAPVEEPKKRRWRRSS